MNDLRTSLSICAVIGALSFTASAQTPAPSLTLEQRVDAIAARYLAKPGGVGLSIAVGRLGEVELAKGYGFADLEFEAKADADTLFRIGSVTKQFTAAAVMRLAEEKKLALDDDLSKHVPTFPLQGKRVTITQLLNHTSGIASYTDIGEEWIAKWPLELSDEELLDLVDDKPFDFEPGTKWAYNNTGYYLLGMVVANVSGKPYAQYIRDEFVAPLELGRLRYDSSKDLIKNRAQGYAFDARTLSNDIPLGMSQPGAAGGLIASARELVLWEMALTGGNVVSRESFERMRTPTVLPDGTDTNYGFGLAIGELEGVKRIAHGGGIFGFNSMLAWFPDADVHVAVISNGEAISSDNVADEVAYAALGIEKRAVKDEPIPAELAARLAGEYEVNGHGMDTSVSVRDGKLFARGKDPGQLEFRLRWQSGDEFRADFDDSVRFVFTPDGQSFTAFQGGGSFKATRAKP